MDAIRCEGLSRTYGEVEALKPLDLTVPMGAIFGFLGRNGAGKTTTIRLLTGLARPTTGRAWINGLETAVGSTTASREFGYLPQEPAFYNWMTPVEFLDYTAQLFHIAREERRQLTAELLALVGLEKAARRRIGGFSGGMRQRLGLAQALIHAPRILILDEPLAGMDPAGRRDVIDLLDSLRGEVTIFFSSHILADVDRICDTIGILHEGELLLTAGREELLARYAANAAQVELTQPAPEAFVTAVRAQPWTATVTAENNHLLVMVTDTTAAKQALLPLIVQHGLIVNKFEWVRPSLEDVFLAISGK